MTRPQRVTILAGLLAPIVFTCTVLLVASEYPGYSHQLHAVSALGAPRSPLSELMNSVGFGVTGILVSVFGVAIPLVQGVTLATVVASCAWVLAGLSFLCLGVWPFPDPQHLDHVLYCIFTSAAGTIAGAWSVSQTHRAPWYWGLSLFAAVAALDLLRLPIAALMDSPSAFGLQQRVHLAILGLWLEVTACLLLYVARQRCSLALG